MRPPLRALIVDDEPVARGLLREMLQAAPTAVEVVGECGSAGEAMAAIRAQRPDVVFLDVQMPGGDGFTVAGALGAESAPAVVFVTAHDRYAARAFEIAATDYLLKPFDEERLQTTLERLERRLATAGETPQVRLLALLEGLQARDRYAERLAVEARDHVTFVPTSRVLWLEAQGKRVLVHSTQGDFTMREGLTSVAERLDPRDFLRVHRSILVRVDKVDEVHRWFRSGYQLVLVNGARLTCGPRYKAAVEETLLGRPRR